MGLGRAQATSCLDSRPGQLISWTLLGTLMDWCQAKWRHQPREFPTEASVCGQEMESPATQHDPYAGQPAYLCTVGSCLMKYRVLNGQGRLDSMHFPSAIPRHITTSHLGKQLTKAGQFRRPAGAISKSGFPPQEDIEITSGGDRSGQHLTSQAGEPRHTPCQPVSS